MAQRIQRGFTTQGKANTYRDQQLKLASVTKAETKPAVDVRFDDEWPIPNLIRVTTWYVVVQFDPKVSDK